MNSRRLAKASEAVREVVSTAILFQLRDPRVQNVTVLHVEVAPDMRTAKVYVSVMGDAKKQSLCMHGLEHARGFLQSRIADRIDTRYVPVLKFVLDQGVKKSAEASQLIREAMGEQQAAPEAELEGLDADELMDDDTDSDETANEALQAESAEPDAPQERPPVTPAAGAPDSA